MSKVKAEHGGSFSDKMPSASLRASSCTKPWNAEAKFGKDFIVLKALSGLFLMS